MLTKPCGRCGGTGHYSYNMIDGTMCYGCQGKGIVPATPSKKGVKVTSLMQYAEVNDIVKAPGVGVARVIEVLSGDFIRKERDPFGGVYEHHYPQLMRFESLLDGKKYRDYRYTPVMEKELGGRLCRVDKKTNIWHEVK